MKINVIIGVLFVVFWLPMNGYAINGPYNLSEASVNTILNEDGKLQELNATDLFGSTQDLNSSVLPISKVSKSKPKSKAIAVTLAVTLGVFGVHRLYLGTSTKVPIIYTLTLGGGFGVLVVSDIIAIIATKDLEDYAPEPKVFMWAE